MRYELSIGRKKVRIVSRNSQLKMYNLKLRDINWENKQKVLHIVLVQKVSLRVLEHLQMLFFPLN